MTKCFFFKQKRHTRHTPLAHPGGFWRMVPATCENLSVGRSPLNWFLVSCAWRRTLRCSCLHHSIMTTFIERKIPINLSDNTSCPRQETAMKDSCKAMKDSCKAVPQTISSSIQVSPLSVTSLSKHTSTTTLQNSIKEVVHSKLENSMSGINNVIQQLQQPQIPPKKMLTTFSASTRPSTVTLVAVEKPRKRKVENLRSSKPVFKKPHTNLPPPTLASCNRKVIGANLRLPRSFTNCSKSAMKYAQMSFPFSDRHNCALVPTAVFSYGRLTQHDHPSTGKTAKHGSAKKIKIDQSQVMKPKYNFRRRVWLLVPHRLAPVGIHIRKVHGPFESVKTRK